MPPGETMELRAKVAVIVRARVLSTALDLLAGALIVNILPKEQFAVLSLLLMVSEVARQLGTLGFAESILYFFEAWPAHARRKLVLRTASLLFVTGSVAALFIFVMGLGSSLWLGHWDAGQRDLVARSLPLLALVALLELPTWPFMQVLIAIDRPRAASLYQVGATVLGLLSLLGPALLGDGAFEITLCLFVAAVIKILVCAIGLLVILPKEDGALPDRALREQLGFSVPLGLNAIAARMNKWADKFIVASLLPSVAMAEYTTASYELTFVTAFPYGIGTVLLPRYVAALRDGGPPALLALWHTSVQRGAVVVIPAAIGAMALAPELIEAVFGASYLPAVRPFQVLCLVLAHRVAQYGALLQAFGQTRIILFMTLTLLGINVGVSLVLTPLLGTTGTAIGTAIANLSGFGLFMRAAAPRLGVPWTQAMPWAYLGKTATSAGVAALVVTSLRALGLRDTTGPLPALLISLATFFVVHVALGRAWGVVSARDVETGLMLVGVKPKPQLT